MSELQLVGLGAIGQRDDLVPQTNSKYGILAAKPLHGLNHLRNICGITGAIGKENAIRTQPLDLHGGSIPWNDGHLTASGIQRTHDILLHTAVNGHHMEPWLCARRGPGCITADSGHSILRNFSVCQCPDAVFQREIRTGQKSLLTAAASDRAGQTPGVHTVDAGDLIPLHNRVQRGGAAEIGWEIIVFPHDHSADGGRLGFIIIVRHTVVPNQGIGHDNTLVGIRGIGENFLIAGHGGVEHDLHDSVGGIAKRKAIVFFSVF